MRICFSLVALFLWVGCSGSGGGGTAAGTTSSTGLVQSSKMSCGSSTCMGTGGLSIMSTGDVQIEAVATAVNLYNSFNQTLIPAFNAIIAKIETGVKNAGAVSCNDISTGFTGQVIVDGTTYDAQTSVSAATGNGALFTYSTMSKRLAAKVSGGANYLTADINCGLETDSSPLVARIITNDGTNQLNAWFERGSANHVRMLMVAKYAGVVYAGWFKTSDGDNYEFAFASQGVLYQGAGQRSVEKVNYQDSAGVSLVCLNSTTGATTTGCTGTVPTPPTIATDQVSVAISTWTNVTNSVVLTSPTYP